MSYKSILLVTICMSSLAVTSTTLGNSSINEKEENILRRKRRDTFSDNYDDNEVMDDATDRNSQLGLEEEDVISNRRMLTQTGGKNKNKNINTNINVSGYTKIQTPRFEKVLQKTANLEATGENWGLVYPVITGANQMSKKVIITFLTSNQLRENLLHIFGCILQKPANFLTEPQYSALYTLYIELRNRPSRILSALKHLKEVPKSNLNGQMKSMMQILGEVLPPYIACAAKFWVQEIQHKRIDLNNLPRNTCSKNFNILREISVHDLELQAIMKPIDAPTRITEQVLGKFFVKILNDVQKLNVALSQAMFGIILSNFPLIPYDPILDEYIRFILQVTVQGKISSWQDIELQQITGDPYRFIKTVIAHILVLPYVPRSIKEALAYVRIHLKPVLTTHVNPDFQIMHKLNARKFDIELLFSFIVPGVYSRETICLKDRFLQHIQDFSLKNSWVLSEMDRLRYTNPHDLLLAFLAKLQRHIPNQEEELSKIVTALLSVLIIDKQNKEFAPNTKNVEIFALFGYLVNPEFGPKVNTIYNKVITTLVSKPQLQTAINKLVPVEKNKCILIDECLKEILQNIEQQNLELPSRMEKLFIELNDILPVQTLDPKCRTNSNSNKPFINAKEKITPAKIGKLEETTFGSAYGIAPEISTRRDMHSFKSSTSTYSGTHLSTGHNRVIIKKAKLVNVLMLPPMMLPNQGITIYINNKGVPVPDNSNIPSFPGIPKVSLPSVIVILKPPEINDPFGNMNSDFKVQILAPLIKIAGSSDLNPILGTSVSNFISSDKCPTLAALLIHLLEMAKLNPSVQRNRELMIDIKTYLSALDLLAVITLPVVLRVARINPMNDILFSIICISEPHKSTVSVTPPSYVPERSLVFVIVDPNKLKEPVDTENPYESLLPNVGSNTPGGNYIEELKIFFTRSKIEKLFPNLRPEEYTSKGFLLMVILQKLPRVPEVTGKPLLKKIVLGYIWAILIPAFFTEVSYPDVMAEFKRQPKVKPDTEILIQLLPAPTNERENIFFNRIQILLEREDLFDILLIPKPTPNTNQKELLKSIFTAVLNSTGKFDSNTRDAVSFYNSKMYENEKDESPVIWEWQKPEVITLKVPLVDLISTVIRYDKLSNENKIAYNDLITYLRENANIFRSMSDFPFQKYETYGTFIRGLFNYLLKSQIVFDSVKNNIKAILPYVMLRGPGAKPIEKFIKGKSVSGRRSASKLEIDV